MKRIVDIPDEMIEAFKQGCFSAKYNMFDFVGYVLNGTELPKEHGRLMILSEDRLKENQINLDFSSQKWVSEVGLSNATVKIIEADKENE